MLLQNLYGLSDPEMEDMLYDRISFVIDSGVRPPRGGEVSDKDLEAGWTKKQVKFIYGYKADVSSDIDTGLIKNVIATSGDVHDGEVFQQLLDGDEPEVYADNAYGSAKNMKALEDNAIVDKVMFKSYRNKPKPKWQVDMNKVWGKTRGEIERIFGHWKTLMGVGRSRYRGWARHQVHFDLIAMAYNLNRASNILRTRTG